MNLSGQGKGNDLSGHLGSRKGHVTGRIFVALALLSVTHLFLIRQHPASPDHAWAEPPAAWSPAPVLIHAQARLGSFRHGTLVTKRAGELVLASPADRDLLTHPGVDLAVPCGAGAYALADGWVEDVIDSQNDRDFRALGFMVMVRHVKPIKARPTYTLYLHLQEAPPVKRGDPVKGSGPLLGTRLGSVGDTGVANGCHVHLEIRHFPSRYLTDSRWREPGNIYGKGNQNSTRTFLDNWEDPLRFLGQDWADFFDNCLSPDGSKLVLLRKLDPQPWTLPAETRLWDLVTGRETIVPFSGFPKRVRPREGPSAWTWHRDGTFRWSPDGRFLAFTRCSGDHDKPICLAFLLDTKTRGASEIVAEELALNQPYPRFQPVGFAGGRVLFTTSPDLYAYELVPKRSVLLHRGVWSAALSSDGRSVAYTIQDANGVPNVWVSDVQGANKRQLTSFAFVDPQQLDVIGWLPGDLAVVFRKDLEAWAVKPDGSRPQRIGW